MIHFTNTVSAIQSLQTEKGKQGIYMRNRKTRTLALLTAGMLFAGSIFHAPAAEAARSKTVDLDGVYHAALGVSTANNKTISRDAYYAKSINKYYKTKRYAKLMSENAYSGSKTSYKGTFTDTVIKGNGKYRVKLTGADFSWETVVSALHVATDIPSTKKITFSDVSLKVNGKTLVTFSEPYMENEKKYRKGGMDIVLLNKDKADLIQELSNRNLRKTRINGYNILTGAGNDSIVVTFNVDGFNYNKGEAVPTPTPLPTATPEPTVEPTETPEAAANKEVNTAVKNESRLTDSDHSIAIVCVVAGALILCGGVIIVVNGRRKRK